MSDPSNEPIGNGSRAIRTVLYGLSFLQTLFLMLGANHMHLWSKHEIMFCVLQISKAV